MNKLKADLCVVRTFEQWMPRIKHFYIREEINEYTCPDSVQGPEFRSHGDCEHWTEAERPQWALVHLIRQTAHETGPTEGGETTWDMEQVIIHLFIYQFINE